ncbi:MAG: hypothetical protein LBV75_02525, partial [Paludibacter sp.]|nr:hypothetical protein [Paludibacter sp.]
SNAKVGEQLPFKVVEFNKDSKRIILSHNRVWEDVKRSENPEEPSEGEKKVVRKTKKEEPAATQVMEKTTLGDIQELADLKENLVKEAVKKMEKAEKTKADKAKKDKEAAAAVAAETTEIAETTTEPAPAKATKPAKESKKAKESEVAVEGETPKKKSTKKSAETSASAEKTEN